MPPPRVLMIRLGAMGDIIHAMPAAVSLACSEPGTRLDWAVDPRWLPLLEGGLRWWRPVPVDRRGLRAIIESVRRVREERYDVAVDLQGLIKSAVVARVARTARVGGFAARDCREREAALAYTKRVEAASTHIADRYMDVAVGAGARRGRIVFPLPEGREEGTLPEGRFVLASPLAGWRSKQWPMERWGELASRMRAAWNMPLVVNVPPGVDPRIEGAVRHESGLPGLIDATRRAAAVVGLDSGPMHLAAAIGVAGVALFGPTDPARNGPVGRSFTVLREAGARTSYRRRDQVDESMARITVDQVMDALDARLQGSPS
jgi:heptosyltransferase-1